MQLVIEQEERQTNITGLSLVLFLFLSIISMMAAYEANKPSDEARSGVVVSFHEYSVQTADSDLDDHSLLADLLRPSLPVFKIAYLAAIINPIIGLAAPKHFDARGPPMRRPTASLVKPHGGAP